MRLVDLTHSIARKEPGSEDVPVVVCAVRLIDSVPLDRLVTLATIVDLTQRADPARIARSDVARLGLAGVGGCILRTDWCDQYLAGDRPETPYLDIEAAAYLLETGVRTVASDFPITSGAADMLLHNNCVLVHCVSGVAGLSRSIVRLIALPLKLNDTYSADARVIAVEEQE